MLAELNKSPAYLLSETEIPPNPNAADDISGVHRWHSLDSEKAYRKNPHPTIGPDDVMYRLNRHGYRCPELDTVLQTKGASVTVACIGASGLFGTGLPEPMILTTRLQQLLEEYLGRSVTCLNFGVGGTGADYVSRMLFSVIPVLQPDIVILTTHPFNRREFIGETGQIYTTQSYPHWHQRFTDPERYQMHVACRTISNPHNHVMHFLSNAIVWQSLCDKSDVMWLFASEGYTEHVESVNHWMDEPRKMVGPGMFPLTKKYRSDPETGLARDMLHPGVLPTKELAEILFARLQELYADRLDGLKQQA
jgi:hypothetical protein